jgi:uncharacterized protein YbjT (DUF2867 family)
MWTAVIQNALKTWWKVTTLVRNPTIMTFHDPHVLIIKGDATASADIASAATGCDVVVHTVSVPLRHKKPTTLFSSVTQAVIDAREIIPPTKRPKHYIVMSSFGTDHGRKLPWPFSWWYERLLWDVADDKEREEWLLAASSLSRTVIKSVLLTDWPWTAYKTTDFAEFSPSLSLRIARQTVAHCIVDIAAAIVDTAASPSTTFAQKKLVITQA